MNERDLPVLLLRVTALEKSISSLETKVDEMLLQMERANGAWTFIKILCSVAIGITVVWAFLTQHVTLR